MNDVSGFLENLSEIEKIRSIRNILKENDKKSNEQQRKRFVTVQDFFYSFFEQSRQDRNLLSDELDFVYCCLSVMLGFALKSEAVVSKKLDLLSNILKKKEEKLEPSNEKMKEVIDHMKKKFEYFCNLQKVLFDSKSLAEDLADSEEKTLSASLLNLLAVQNLQKGHLSKSQLLFKRALLRAKLENRNMSARDYVDDIYNTNTETKIGHQKLTGEGPLGNDPFSRPTHQSEEFLLYNSALLLIKRKKFLEAVEIFQSIQNNFRNSVDFWYRYGQAAKGIFLEDVEHVSKLYDYYFHHKKRKFYSHDRKTEKTKANGPDADLEDFVSFFVGMVDVHKKSSKSDFKKLSNSNLKEILNRKKLVTMFKAKNLLTLTNKLYSQNSK